MEIIMDIFCEYIVKRKKTLNDYLIISGIIFAALFLTFLIMLFYNYTFGFGLFFIFLAWFGAVFLIRAKSIEYEYIFTDHYLDIDKIMAKRRRKRVLSLDYKNAIICACIDDANYENEYKNTNGITKTHNFIGTGDKDIYFADFPCDNGRIRILIQPSDKMKDAMKSSNPRATHIL